MVANIGRLSEQKGMEYFIKSIPDVIKKHKNITFIIVGDGELKEDLQKMAHELGIEKNIVFLGYRNDILNVIDQIDLVVLSSLWEGLPLTPIETFMQKKTIIATDVDGTPEIVKNYYNGILVKKQNSDQISESIIKLYEDSELRKKMEINAYKTYLEKFTVDKFIKRYREYYDAIIKGDRIDKK